MRVRPKGSTRAGLMKTPFKKQHQEELLENEIPLLEYFNINFAYSMVQPALVRYFHCYRLVLANLG